MKISTTGFFNRLTNFAIAAGLAPGITDSLASVFADDLHENWGIGISYRMATIPYVGTENHIGSFIPTMYHEDDLIFLRGTYGGIKPLKFEKWEFSLMGGLRFMDLPDALYEKKFADDLFMGIQARNRLTEHQTMDLEVLADSHGRMVSNLRWSGMMSGRRWKLQPFAQVQLKSRQMNSFYYGLDQEALDQGYELSTGMFARFHVFSNLYMLTSAGFTYLDNETTRSSFIEDSWTSEVTVGFSIGRDSSFSTHSSSKTLPRPYLRIAHGLGSYSNFLDILAGDIEKDPHNNQLTSVFYGFPLSGSLFGIPVDTYLTAGGVWHWRSQVQPTSQELVLGFKFYYTLPLCWLVRVGFAEGVSYISKPTHIEYANIEQKQLEPANWQNYLDFSLDVNLGDILSDSLEHIWLGIGVHHRSAIFGKSQQFGRSNAGSNYNTLYVQIDL